jgi:hypothetical protein
MKKAAAATPSRQALKSRMRRAEAALAAAQGAWAKHAQAVHQPTRQGFKAKTALAEARAKVAALAAQLEAAGGR